MRTFFHYLASLVLWGIFFYHWHIVSQQAVSAGTALAIKAVSTLVVVGITFTILWVSHNVRIAKANQRQDSLRSPQDVMTEDTLGRPVETPDVQRLKLADRVDIEVTEDRKIYRRRERDA
jgi:hypothetical protein